MTDTPETGPIDINQLHFFLAPVSGTCVTQIWDQIRLVPDFGADSVLFHARKWCVRVCEMMMYDLFIPFQLTFNARYNISSHSTANSSSTSLSAVLIFGARKFHSSRIWYENRAAPKSGARKWSRFMAQVSVACVMGIRLCTSQ